LKKIKRKILGRGLTALGFSGGRPHDLKSYPGKHSPEKKKVIDREGKSDIIETKEIYAKPARQEVSIFRRGENCRMGEKEREGPKRRNSWPGIGTGSQMALV